MKLKLCLASLVLTGGGSSLQAQVDSSPALRPPAVPLVAHDPYFSIWSPADKLTDADTAHWTGKQHRLNSAVTIDGKSFRVMGAEPAATPALPQTRVEVLPTRTIYSFEGAGAMDRHFLDTDGAANVPLLLIGGAAPTFNQGRGSLQEMPQTQLFQGITKWSDRVPSPELLPSYLAKAFRVARAGRPGPVQEGVGEPPVGARGGAPDLRVRNPVAPLRRARALFPLGSHRVTRHQLPRLHHRRPEA